MLLAWGLNPWHIKKTLRGSVRSWSCFRNNGITQNRPNIADVLWHDAGTEVDQKPRGRGGESWRSTCHLFAK